jgi:cyclophilin family peptidyl-prolyl cis-trans isomerase
VVHETVYCSQFFITFDAQPILNGKHVVFGKLESGFDVLDAIEQAGTPKGTPTKRIIIADCGEVVSATESAATTTSPTQHEQQEPEAKPQRAKRKRAKAHSDSDTEYETDTDDDDDDDDDADKHKAKRPKIADENAE